MTTARERTAHLAALLRTEHHALAEFLVALAAFDGEQGWLELGHRSLFEFLVRELGLPKGPAYYRMTAAGLIQRYPELVEPLRDGRLHLSSVTQLAKVITPENRAEVVPRFFRLSGREAKEVVAELAPAAALPVRTVVTSVRSEAPRAPAPSPATGDLLGFALADPSSSSTPPAGSHLQATTTLTQGERGSSEELTQVKSASPAPALAPVRPQPAQVEPLTAETSRLHVTVSRRLLQKLAAARDALSHSHPGASEETIIEVGLDLVLERFAKRRGFGAKPRKNAAPPPTSTSMKETEPPISRPEAERSEARPAPAAPRSTARSRYIPAPVRRAVWERDRGCCAWPLESGGVCGSTYQVEFDHVDGWARGAPATVEALRLLCRSHQDVSARRLYGNDLMNAYTRPKGPTCSEPVAAYGATAPEGAVVRSRVPDVGALVARTASEPDRAAALQATRRRRGLLRSSRSSIRSSGTCSRRRCAP